MCFAFDAEPPIARIAGAAVAHERLVLTSHDGTKFAAFGALADAPSGAGVLVLPDRRGLYHFYEEIAMRLAERGHSALALDYYGRTAGLGDRDEGFDAMSHAGLTTPEGIQRDIAAGIDWLRSADGGNCEAVVTVGFCFGGRASWLAASAGHGIAGAAGLYGHPGQHEMVPGEGPTVRAPETKAPILALQAGDDANIPAELNVAYDEALTAAGVEHEVITYEGAPHSFFDKYHDEFAEACADAWARILAFVAGVTAAQ